MIEKISVIVPIFKVERYLAKCIESLLNQTYNNLEIILVNDGSPDRCGEICDHFAARDNRIKVIHKQNGGLSDARNIGVKNAKGEYISFIDSDDYIHPEYYEFLVYLLKKYDADISQCDYDLVYEDSLILRDHRKDDYKEMVYEGSLDILNNLYNDNYGKTVMVWNKLYRRELFKGVTFPVGKIHEDELTTYKILFGANRLVISDRIMYYYLQRTTSIMGKGFNVDSLTLIEAYFNQIQFYRNHRLHLLEEKAAFRLEHLIRGSMNRVINYNLEGKKQVLNELIIYYRNNLNLFTLFPSTTKTKVVREIFKRLPMFIIRWLYQMLNLGKKAINT
jgi:glycosyltransferase involved in cell wall biosynthesis